ncbi:hypothetical protein B0H14DRAFT_2606290 [Mycena olivaceomarginata]|nr:hypothetical protein B0H14DRAFT_2606290 [Mycena olivaceomarginata]
MTKSVKLGGGGSADVIIPQDNPPAKKSIQLRISATQATEHGLFMKLSGALVAGCRGVVIDLLSVPPVPMSHGSAGFTKMCTDAPLVVVGGTDSGLWGMHKARVDACTLPAPYFSVKHGVRDGGHAKRGCGTDPIYQLPSAHKQRRVPRTPLSGHLRFGLSPLFLPWSPRPRHWQEHTTFKLAHPSAPGPLSTRRMASLAGVTLGSASERGPK